MNLMKQLTTTIKIVHSILNTCSRKFASAFRNRSHSDQPPLRSLLTNDDRSKSAQEPSVRNIKKRILRDKELRHGKRALTAEDLLLDPQYSYFILHASYGDKWIILSFLPEFLKNQRFSKILALDSDRRLIEIFLGKETTARSITFLDDDALYFASSIIKPTSMSSTALSLGEDDLTQTFKVLKKGFPKNIVRHLHIVKYPFLCDLALMHGLTYATCQRMVLCMAHDSAPCQPGNYSEKDKAEVDAIYDGFANETAEGAVLFNAHNISHASFDLHQISLIVKRFEFHNIQVAINTTGHPSPDQFEGIAMASRMSATVTVPGHLLAMLSDKMVGVVGIVGGAMNVAVQFSKSHILSFYTEGRFFNIPLKTLFGGRHSDNLWLYYSEDWPCFFEERVIKFIDFSILSRVGEDLINENIDEFVRSVFHVERGKQNSAYSSHGEHP